MAASTIASRSASASSMPESCSASVTIARVMVCVAGILHARPDDAGRERGAEPDAGEVGHETAAGIEEVGHARHYLRDRLEVKP